jgi:predicted ester cyclase
VAGKYREPYPVSRVLRPHARNSSDTLLAALADPKHETEFCHSPDGDSRVSTAASSAFLVIATGAVCLSPQQPKEFSMSKEQDNKAIVGRWFQDFWGNPWNPNVIEELAAPDMLLQYSLHAPRRGREDVRNFMIGFREAFPDLNFWGAAGLIAEGDHVVGRWEGGGTHTGPAFCDFLVGSLPAASGRKMRFSGTTVIRVENGKIAEEVGLDDGVTALQQLGILQAA